jgi:hypothetical protein
MTEITNKTRNAKRIVWFCVVGIVFVLAGFALFALELGNKERLSAQERFDPCVTLSEAVANENRERIPPLTRECKEFLNGLGPLVTIKLSCAIIEKARYVCPAPGTTERSGTQRSGEVPLGPALTGGAVPEPSDQSDSRGEESRRPADVDPGKPKERGQTARPPTQPPSDATPPTPVPLVPTPPQPAPGNSGESAAQPERGVKTCVELVVSACVEAGLRSDR